MKKHLNHNFIKSEVQLNFKDDLVKDIAISNDKKKALLAAGLSAILPGSGQFYLGKNFEFAMDHLWKLKLMNLLSIYF